MKRGRKSYTNEFLIKKLQEASVILGRTPSQSDIAELPDFPDCKVYRTHFGTFAKAKTLAGLPPSLMGMHNPKRNKHGYKRSFNFKTKNKMLSFRFQTLHRDNFTCQYCGCTPQDGIRLEVDHIIPRSKGGETTLNNLITACHNCNLGKKAMILDNNPKKIPQRVKNKRLSEASKNNQICWLTA